MRAAMVVMVAALAAAEPAQPGTGGRFQGVAAGINTQLQGAVAKAQGGDHAGARGEVASAYFDRFEHLGMEGKLGSLDPALKINLEAQFGAVREALGRGDVSPVTLGMVAKLEADLLAAGARLDAAGESVWGGFLSAFFILLREGFEALLVVGGMVAFLSRAGRKQDVRTVGVAVVVALALSVVLAVVLGMVATGAGLAREVLEGVTLLVASVVLFYVSHWLLSRAEAARWNAFIKERMGAAVGEGSSWAIFATAFLAVFREGAETVLFLAATAGEAEGAAQKAGVAAGVVLGSAAIGVLYWGFRRGLVKLPLGPYFAVTGALLYGLAIVFAGNGVAELQAAGWISITPLPWVPAVPALGIGATLEGVTAQSILVLAVLGSLAFMMGRRTAGGAPGTPQQVAAKG